MAEAHVFTVDEQRAILNAVATWIATARAAGYKPIVDWTNAENEVWHSALLRRLLRGKEPLPEPPPLHHAYPVYPDV